MKFKVRIRQCERGLLFRDGEFTRMLAPGVYRLWSRLWSRTRICIEVVNTLETQFVHPRLDAMLRTGDSALAAALEVINVAEHEHAILWRDGRFYRIVGPGRHAFWKSPYALRIELFDGYAPTFSHARLESILQQSGAKAYLEVVDIEPHVEGWLLVDGQLKERLGAGKHVFWKSAARLRLVPVHRLDGGADAIERGVMRGAGFNRQNAENN